MDITTYNKSTRIPYNSKIACGYQPRPLGRLNIRAIIVHTTNGNAGTSLDQEANYIANSRDISSHYLIGKHGDLIQFLDPDLYIAYHAGCVKSTTFSNLFSIGIEMHNTPAEGKCTTLQLAQLDILVRQLITKYKIEEKYIDTHRNVAVFCPGSSRAGQLGRKIDPSGFEDIDFYTWRRTLYTVPTFNLIKYKVIAPVVNIRSAPVISNNVVGQLMYGDTFESAATKIDEHGLFIKGDNTYAHLTHGNHNGVSVDNLGFIHRSNLRII